jgi:hypothetical protein
MNKLKSFRILLELFLITSVGWLWVISDTFFNGEIFVKFFFYAFGLFFVGLLLNKYTRKFLIIIIPPLETMFDWWTPKRPK